MTTDAEWSSHAGWASDLGDFVRASRDAVVAALEELRTGRFGDPAESVGGDGRRSRAASGAVALRSVPGAGEHGTVLEYELPREGGRRPDVLMLGNGVIAVIEFKSSSRNLRADIDQVAAYARDIKSSMCKP